MIETVHDYVFLSFTFEILRTTALDESNIQIEIPLNYLILQLFGVLITLIFFIIYYYIIYW